jgi:hypothetical protein
VPTKPKLQVITRQFHSIYEACKKTMTYLIETLSLALAMAVLFIVFFIIAA